MESRSFVKGKFGADVTSGEDRGECGGYEGADDVGRLVADSGVECPDQAVRDRSQECCYGDEECGCWRVEKAEGEGEGGGNAGGGDTGEGSGERDGSVGTWRDLSEGCDQARGAAEELSDLGFRGVGEGRAEGGDEGSGEEVRARSPGEDGAEDGDGAVGQGVAGAAASSVFLGGAGTLLAPVAEPGQEGTSDHDEGEDSEASWTEAGVDDGSDEEPAEGAAAADHSERVGQGGEGRGYEEGYKELCYQRTFERRWKRWRA